MSHPKDWADRIKRSADRNSVMGRMFAPAEPLRAIFCERGGTGQLVCYTDIVLALEEPDEGAFEPPTVWTESQLRISPARDEREIECVVAAVDAERALHRLVRELCNRGCQWTIEPVGGGYESSANHLDGCLMAPRSS